ncbi:MAG: hypothetical protein JSW58_14040 [Candidatus Latescibacterota bacterium]|nr:MAG: hypothetical protein JSW58_14040 [Candidatus Latescibacterota bacterium]
MKLPLKVAVFVAILLIAGRSGGQNTEVTRATMVGLPGVTIYVDSLSQALVERGMTEDVFKVKVELRLLEAGVKILNPAIDEPAPGNPTLYLDITTVFDEAVEQCLYGIRLELTQTVRLERNPGLAVFNVPTWSVGGVGIYSGEWRDAMVEDVLNFTDEFIDAFVTVNPVVEE